MQWMPFGSIWRKGNRRLSCKRTLTNSALSAKEQVFLLALRNLPN